MRLKLVKKSCDSCDMKSELETKEVYLSPLRCVHNGQYNSLTYEAKQSRLTSKTKVYSSSVITRRLKCNFVKLALLNGKLNALKAKEGEPM